MKHIKKIFFVLSLVLLGGFSVVLFSGEVSAQMSPEEVSAQMSPEEAACFNEVFVDDTAECLLSNLLNISMKEILCESDCSAGMHLHYITDELKACRAACSDIWQSDEIHAACNAAYDTCMDGSPIAGGESCPESILSDSYDVDDDNCCISLDICQDYVEGGVCEIPVAEGSDEMVEVDLCKEPGTCVSPLTDDGIGGCCVMYESWDDCENFSDFVDVNSATGAKDEECYLCPDGTTLDGIECNDGEGEMEELEHVKWCVSSSTEPSTICSKSRLIQGQSCCDGYKKIKDGSTYTCKPCGKDGVCCGIALNTVVPFIGDCIQFQKSASDPNTTVVGPTTAFPKLMQGLSKLMVTAILVFSFVLLIVAGVMMTASGGSDANYNKGKELIGKVVIGIALLGASGVILKLINPNFFG